MNRKKLILTLLVSTLSISSGLRAQDLLLCLTPEDGHASAARPQWVKSKEVLNESERRFVGQLEIHCLLSAKTLATEEALRAAIKIVEDKLTHNATAETEDGSLVDVKRVAQTRQVEVSNLDLVKENLQFAPKELATPDLRLWRVAETLQKVGDTNKLSLERDLVVNVSKSEMLVLTTVDPESVDVQSTNGDDQKYEKSLKKLQEEMYLKHKEANAFEFHLRLSVEAQFPASEDSFSSLVGQLKNRMRKPLKQKLQTDLLPTLVEHL